eukprot:6639667-Alexandrium_andersonii.AAC.1
MIHADVARAVGPCGASGARREVQELTEKFQRLQQHIDEKTAATHQLHETVEMTGNRLKQVADQTATLLGHLLS